MMTPVMAASSAEAIRPPDSVEVSTHAAPEVSQPVTVSETVKTPSASTDSKKVSARIYSITDRKVSTHKPVSAGTGWKASAKRPGFLIRRISGYDIAEDEYGVSYLKVIERHPKKKTSADFTKYEHAGFFTWAALEACGRLHKETKTNGRKQFI